MKCYLIIAHDAQDEGVLARREASRMAHFERVGPFIETGQVIAGGGMLNDENRVIGSAFFAVFESQEVLQDWLDEDALSLNRVWERFEIIPMKMAVRDGKIIV